MYMLELPSVKSAEMFVLTEEKRHSSLTALHLVCMNSSPQSNLAGHYNSTINILQ